MTEFAPILLAIGFIIAMFGYSLTRGVVPILTSGFSALASLAVFFAGVNFLSASVEMLVDTDLDWKVTLGVSAGAAILTYLVSLFVFGFILKRMFNQEGWFHWAVDGFAGGVLSIFPSLVVIVFAFTCIRVAGTLFELNYAASVSQEGIEKMAGRVPPYPVVADLRNGIERVPFFAEGMDYLDPFSNRRYRNAAAFLLMSGSGPLRSHLLSDPNTAPIAENQELYGLRRETDIFRALESQDRLGLVLDSSVRKVADSEELASRLESVKLKPVLVGFVKNLRPPETPGYL